MAVFCLGKFRRRSPLSASSICKIIKLQRTYNLCIIITMIFLYFQFRNKNIQLQIEINQTMLLLFIYQWLIYPSIFLSFSLWCYVFFCGFLMCSFYDVTKMTWRHIILCRDKYYTVYLTSVICNKVVKRMTMTNFTKF